MTRAKTGKSRPAGPPPVRYVALGDSMSIDRYPSIDLVERSPAGAGPLFVEYPVGAASLFHRNESTYWPEFEGRDLATLYPGITSINLASDGASLGDVFGEQLPAVEASDDRVLVTLTIGGNDLLSAVAGQPGATVMRRVVNDVAEGYRAIVGAIREKLPRSLLLVTTIYDPTDRTARLPGVFPDFDKVPLVHLDTLNEAIRETADGNDIRVAEVYGHFLGHGVTAPEKDRWYWSGSLIEPGAAGASEIRRVWLDAVEGT